MAATIVAASALTFAQPVFAQSMVPGPGAFANSTMLQNPAGANPTNPDAATPYSFGEPCAYSLPSEGPTLAPAPEQPADAQPGSIYVPPLPASAIETYGYQPMEPNLAEPRLPDTMTRPGNEFETPVR